MTTKTTPIKNSFSRNIGMTAVHETNYGGQEKIKLQAIPCQHLHLVPLEVSFIRITHPNGYKEQPKCEFYVGISLATALRVRKYFCPECNEIIKAPSIYAEEK